MILDGLHTPEPADVQGTRGDFPTDIVLGRQHPDELSTPAPLEPAEDHDVHEAKDVNAPTYEQKPDNLKR